jgi:iron complex transport system substrate-binding protein
MRSSRFLVILMVLLCGVPSASAQQEGRFSRIVTLSPHLTELVFAAGAGDKLVGISAHSDYPAEAARLPAVSASGNVNVEAVLHLKPDLVLAWQSGNRAADLERLEHHGLRVLRTDAARLEDVSALLRRIGALAGTQRVAEAQAAEFERKIAALRARYAGRPPLRGFIEIWHEPLMTVNDQHILSRILQLCGGENVFGDVSRLTPIVSVEQLYAVRIDAVLSVAFREPAQAARTWAARDKLPAVRSGRVYGLDPDLLSRMTPRLALGAEQLCAALDKARR